MPTNALPIHFVSSVTEVAESYLINHKIANTVILTFSNICFRFEVSGRIFVCIVPLIGSDVLPVFCYRGLEKINQLCSQIFYFFTSLGNLSLKNRLRTRFSAQNLDRLLNRGYAESNFRQESRTDSKDGRQDLRQFF